jgi:hypothetical protein
VILGFENVLMYNGDAPGEDSTHGILKPPSTTRSGRRLVGIDIFCLRGLHISRAREQAYPVGDDVHSVLGSR